MLGRDTVAFETEEELLDLVRARGVATAATVVMVQGLAPGAPACVLHLYPSPSTLTAKATRELIEEAVLATRAAGLWPVSDGADGAAGNLAAWLRHVRVVGPDNPALVADTPLLAALTLGRRDEWHTLPEPDALHFMLRFWSQLQRNATNDRRTGRPNIMGPHVRACVLDAIKGLVQDTPCMDQVFSPSLLWRYIQNYAAMEALLEDRWLAATLHALSTGQAVGLRARPLVGSSAGAGAAGGRASLTPSTLPLAPLEPPPEAPVAVRDRHPGLLAYYYMALVWRMWRRAFQEQGHSWPVRVEAAALVVAFLRVLVHDARTRETDADVLRAALPSANTQYYAELAFLGLVGLVRRLRERWPDLPVEVGNLGSQRCEEHFRYARRAHDGHTLTVRRLLDRTRAADAEEVLGLRAAATAAAAAADGSRPGPAHAPAATCAADVRCMRETTDADIARACEAGEASAWRLLREGLDFPTEARAYATRPLIAAAGDEGGQALAAALQAERRSEPEEEDLGCTDGKPAGGAGDADDDGASADGGGSDAEGEADPPAGVGAAPPPAASLVRTAAGVMVTREAMVRQVWRALGTQLPHGRGGGRKSGPPAGQQGAGTTRVRRTLGLGGAGDARRHRAVPAGAGGVVGSDAPAGPGDDDAGALADDGGDDPVCEIADIVGEKEVDGQRFYCVEWAGEWDEEEEAFTWEPESRLRREAPEAIDAWREALREAEPAGPVTTSSGRTSRKPQRMDV